MFKVAFFILPTSTRLYAGESNNMNDNKNEITSSNLQVVKTINKTYYSSELFTPKLRRITVLILGYDS